MVTTQAQEKQTHKSKAEAAVEESWGTLEIDRETLIYIAEDKELEYDEDTRLSWESFGSWQDDRTAEEIITDIYSSRTSKEGSIWQ